MHIFSKTSMVLVLFSIVLNVPVGASHKMSPEDLAALGQLQQIFGPSFTFVPVPEEGIVEESQSTKELRDKAMSGNVKAMVALGEALSGAEEDVLQPIRMREAFYWFKRAAEANHPLAMSWLSAAYLYGRGVTPSAEDAIHWSRKAIKLGNAFYDKMVLARCLADGHGCKGDQRDKAEALSLYRDCAKEGILEAIECMGFMLYFGHGCEVNKAESLECFRKASRANHISSMRFLARRLLDSGFEQDRDSSLKEAYSLLEKVVASGNEPAQGIFYTMKMYGKGCDQSVESRVAGFKSLCEAAHRGETISQYFLGLHYLMPLEGKPGPADLGKAFDMFKKAAMTEEGYSCYAYAHCLYFGIGCKPDEMSIKQARINYARGAAKGIKGAHEAVAFCLFYGAGAKGNVESKERAFKWLSTCTHQNSCIGNIFMGYQLATGEGVKYNPQEARKVLSVVEDHEMVPSLILYTLLRERKYEDALAFYQKALGKNGYLKVNELLESYLKFRLQLQGSNKFSGVGKGDNKSKSHSKGADFEQEVIQRNAIACLAYYGVLSNHFKANMKFSGGKLVPTPRPAGKSIPALQRLWNNSTKAAHDRAWRKEYQQQGLILSLNRFYGSAASPVILESSIEHQKYQELAGLFKQFNSSFRKAQDFLDRHHALKIFLDELTAISEELFMGAFKEEFKGMKPMFEQHMKDIFVLTMKKSRSL